jgi:hypothetical protein
MVAFGESRPDRVGRRRTQTLAGLALAALAAAPASPASAAAPRASKLTFSAGPLVRTPYFQFHTAGGDLLSGRLRLRNTSGRTITVLLRPTDLGTANTGGATFDAPASGRPGRWLKLAKRSVALHPGQSAVVSFRAVLPKGLAPGEHYAGIVAFDEAQLASGGKAAKPSRSTEILLRHVTRVGLPIRFTVPGPSERKLELSTVGFDSNAAGALLRLGLRNSGNQLVRRTTLSLKVVRGGRTVLARSGAISDFVPGAAIRYPVLWPGRPVRGSYHLTGAIRPAGGPVVRIDQDVTFGNRQARAFKRATGASAAGNGGSSPFVSVILGVAVLIALAMTVAYIRMRRQLRRARS